MWISGKTKVSDFIRAADSSSCLSMNNKVGGTPVTGVAGMLQFAGWGAGGGLLRVEKNNLPTRKKKKPNLGHLVLSFF